MEYVFPRNELIAYIESTTSKEDIYLNYETATQGSRVAYLPVTTALIYR